MEDHAKENDGRGAGGRQRAECVYVLILIFAVANIFGTKADGKGETSERNSPVRSEEGKREELEYQLRSPVSSDVLSKILQAYKI